MSGSAPAYQGVDGAAFYSLGRALPIAAAKLRVGKQERITSVGELSRSVSFEFALPSGACTMQTWFLDADGGELCGAH